jgi:8-amino-7-oxononanoate synthase
MPELDSFLINKLQNAAKSNQLRKLNFSFREQGVYVERGGKKLISFSCNDYLGLSCNQQIKNAATAAIEKYGAGGGASRLITGNNPLYEQLEIMLAKIKGTESALVFGSGYLANIGIIPALVGRGDLIIVDKLIHASLIDGCKLSGAKILRFTHNNTHSCERILKNNRSLYKKCLIVTDHIFSMDGDVAPIDELCNLAEKYDAWLLTDDAHGLGTIAQKHHRIPHLQMGTLSKAVGSYGGYVCASKIVVDYLSSSARSLIYSTSLPPATLGASIAALKIINEDKKLCAKPLINAILFTSLLGMADATSPIVPIIIGNEEKTVATSNKLENNGFLVTAIRPPTVPKGTARLRVALSALHKKQDIEQLANLIKEMKLL